MIEDLKPYYRVRLDRDTALHPACSTFWSKKYKFPTGGKHYFLSDKGVRIHDDDVTVLEIVHEPPYCREKARLAGLSHPKSNCFYCGSILRHGWKCPQMQDDKSEGETMSATPQKPKPLRVLCSENSNDSVVFKLAELSHTPFIDFGDDCTVFLTRRKLEAIIQWAESALAVLPVESTTDEDIV